MITEDFCSFEVAQLLKEKGFNEPCTSKYCTDGSFDRSFCHYKNSEINKDAYNAPTHQMAMAWLRGKHIFIQIGVVEHSTITVLEDYYFFKVYRDRRFISHEKTETYHTYKEAVEAALKYSLENLL